MISSSDRNKSGSSSILRHNFQRSISPSGNPYVRFSTDQNRHVSPNRSVATSSTINLNSNKNNNTDKKWSYGSKKTCLCSPTTHPGSFRCSLHKNLNSNTKNLKGNRENGDVSYRSHKLYARRSAMVNSLVRIGTVEGELMKRALAALIRPSSHQQRRRNDFQPKPSRLSIMSKADC
ncbi:uncharacterized protein [Rutidosis leptorrhynchoides]|uniref:uncharacterized protein n=1 Tax=Rutidosis leptorrhynchoides TaxID=125765 RepID=UPI003A9930B5